MTVAMTVTAVPGAAPSCRSTVFVASTAMMERNVSHPMEVSQEMMPGTFCPCTPNAARERTIVGAEPRLPATAIRPQRKNENVTPTAVTRAACQNEMPNHRMNEPYEIPKTEMLAANHGQNRSDGFAVRSDSGTMSIPRDSISGVPSIAAG